MVMRWMTANLQRFSMVTKLCLRIRHGGVAGRPAAALGGRNQRDEPPRSSEPATFTSQQRAFFQHLNRWELRLWREIAGKAAR